MKEPELGAGVVVCQAERVRPFRGFLCFPVGCVRGRGGVAVAGDSSDSQPSQGVTPPAQGWTTLLFFQVLFSRNPKLVDDCLLSCSDSTCTRSPDCETGVPGRGRGRREELTSSPPGLDAVPPAVRPLPGGSQTLLQRPARG